METQANGEPDKEEVHRVEPDEVPKNCEPGASCESMLVAFGSIEEIVEQEMDSSFAEKNVPGSTTSTISEIQDGIQECAVNSEDEGESLTEDIPAVKIVEAENVEVSTQEEPSTPPERECWSSMEWRSKRKHIFILSKAGKPVYTRHGSEDKLATIFGVMQALVSFVETNQGDVIRSIHAGDSHFVFLVKDHVILVSVSKTGESVPQLVLQLMYVYNQIVSVLTKTQLTRIYEQRRNYDLRRLLAGAERLLDSLLDLTEREPAFLLGAIRCLPLASTVRDQISNTISSMCSKIKNLVFAILLANNQLITLVRMKKYVIHPLDLHLIFNLVNSSESFKTAESWTPICLPKFDASGYLHGHVSYLSDDCQACLLLLTVDRDAFFTLSEAKQKISERLRRNNCLEAINVSVSSEGLMMDQVGVPEVRHFLYKAISTAQFTSPALEVPYHTSENAERLMSQYQALHHRLHSSSRPLKLLFYQLETDAMLGWITSGFELYVTFEPLVTKLNAINAVNKLLRWMKKEEDRLFSLNAPTF
ncbi:vacuolar fusion protein MON1 homolog A [Neocloeon triangulifer]|uniref:vacuolar fusion protein MON1 homolog A n=1 Tax=Neocloeon triangulifer TaxID=2078957 RepID=UPI00286F1257|nr:vacuolar fusion protein MON1 homolog A [Neocloeon triangulifer]